MVVFAWRIQVLSENRALTDSRRFASSFAECPKFSFSGHQTFSFRYAWLPKGIAAVRDDPRVFSRPDAIVRLGVGKNMVASIRFWCAALGLITVNRGQASVTALGSFLFGSQGIGKRPFRWHVERYCSSVSSAEGPLGGADPFLEDPGTLWLLHWQLASNPTPASTWFLVLTWWPDPGFTRDDLVRWLSRAAAENELRRVPLSRNVMRRDVDTFLRTYVPSNKRRSRRPLEDSFDCPLTELGLVRRVDRDYFSVPRGPRPSLPTAILVYALADYWHRAANGQETMTLERALYDPGSPGAAFRLGDLDLVDRFEHLPTDCEFRYDETAGQRLILRDATHINSSSADGFQALRSYYTERRA